MSEFVPFDGFSYEINPRSASEGFLKWRRTIPNAAFNRRVQTFARRAHKRGLPVAVDVGAHVGLLTRPFAKLFPNVLAIEADPVTFQYLEKNTSDLSNVIRRNVAVGASRKKIGVVRNPCDHSMNHVSDDEDDDVAVRVQMTTVDALLKGLGGVGFVKLDVEGYELEVLKGMTKTLEKWKPHLAMEMIGHHMQRFQASRRVVWMWLHGKGYLPVKGGGHRMGVDELERYRYKDVMWRHEDI